MLVNKQHADDDIAFKDLFSYKMIHAGWRYQVSLAIQSGYIVHVNNGTAHGVLNDLNSVRMSDLVHCDDDCGPCNCVTQKTRFTFDGHGC